MPYYLYVSLADDDKLSVFTIDAETGKLTPKADIPMPSPSVLAISPNKNTLYVSHRTGPEMSSHRIDHSSGGLTQNGNAAPGASPTYLFPDRKGRYLLSAYYQSGHAAVHPIGDDGAVGDPPIEWLAADLGAHAIQTDLSNRFAFVPCIARMFDNVLAPLNEGLGANTIFQFRFDENTGRLAQNSPARVEPEKFLGPRYLCFHPTLDTAYFSNEQGGSVTGYHLDTSTGTLSAFQTITTLPDGYSGKNTCSQIQITSSGKFLYVPNRGHHSIAGFSIDGAGQLTALGQVPTEAMPVAFSLDPQDKFLFAVGQETRRLASYRINGDTGELTPLETYPVGNRPMHMLVTSLGD